MATSPKRRRPDWSTLSAPDPALRVAVIVPVRDEARRLPGALAALARQVDKHGKRLPRSSFEVIVLANNCSDSSAEIVRRFALRHRWPSLQVVEVEFPKALAHVGHARSCLMNEACRRLRRTAGDAGVIASTDGDTRVAPDWLSATLAEIDRGVDAVGGRIAHDDDVTLPRDLRALARRDAVYQRLRVRLEHAIDPDAGDPWPRHHQHFGASLAVTVAAYRQVGGMPAEPFLEDEAFYRRLVRADLRVRHSGRVNVVTSSRRRGRVAVGLSWQLREWQARLEAREDPMVAHPRRLGEALSLRRRLRALWTKRSERAGRGDGKPGADEERILTAVATRLDARPRQLLREWKRAETFGAFWMELEARWHDRCPPRLRVLQMRPAIESLRRLVGRAEGQRRSRRSSR